MEVTEQGIVLNQSVPEIARLSTKVILFSDSTYDSALHFYKIYRRFRIWRPAPGIGNDLASAVVVYLKY